MGYWQVMIVNWTQPKLKTTYNWSEMQRKDNWTEWSRSMAFCWWDRAGKTSVLPTRNHTREANRWLPSDTFPILKRLIMNPGQTFDMRVQLLLSYRKDYPSHQLCVQRTFMEDKLIYWMYSESIKLTDIKRKVMRIAHANVFPIPNIFLTAMVTWITKCK